ncbi:MAG: prepilin-type N-terminal cleavage/methylation domain-containing protein [Planctomycetota bacterium]|jgi:prepilin-type N-terminal cleavage/methylation domain-containing protein|nr:prepilin-type N-terminal cleavage/methylation domain-containing protein [Planctomycetota bacterium]
MTSRRGLTLLEVLLVVAILGMVAAVLVPRLAARSQVAPTVRAARQLAQLDARLREQARSTSSAITVRVDARGWHAENAPTAVLWAAPSGLAMHLRDFTGERVSQFTIDGAGRGPDLALILRSGDVQQRVRVFGLSGQWVDDD